MRLQSNTCLLVTRTVDFSERCNHPSKGRPLTSLRPRSEYRLDSSCSLTASPKPLMAVAGCAAPIPAGSCPVLHGALPPSSVRRSLTMIHRPSPRCCTSGPICSGVSIPQEASRALPLQRPRSPSLTDRTCHRSLDDRQLDPEEVLNATVHSYVPVRCLSFPDCEFRCSSGKRDRELGERSGGREAMTCSQNTLSPVPGIPPDPFPPQADTPPRSSCHRIARNQASLPSAAHRHSPGLAPMPWKVPAQGRR